MKNFFISLLLLIISVVGCNQKKGEELPPQPAGTIKGTIDLPIKGNIGDIIIITNDQEITVSNKSGRTEEDNISGTFSLKSTTNKTQLLTVLDKNTLQPVALLFYNPELDKQLRITVKSTVDAILKQHPLLQTNDPLYDAEFNKLLESVEGVAALYAEVERLYKTFNPTSGLVTIADILPLIGFSKIPLIWQELEEKFYSQWSTSIDNAGDAFLENHNIPTNKQFMTFQVVNPLSRYVAYSVKRGRHINKIDENIEDSFSTFEFIGPAENVGLYYTRDWLWNLRSGKPVIPQTERGSLRNVNVEHFDYADVYLYSLGSKVNQSIHPQDIDLFFYMFAVNSIDIGMAVYEAVTQIGDYKKNFSQTLKGRGRDAKEPLKRLLVQYALFLTKKAIIPSNYLDKDNFKMSKFISESIKLTAEFLSDEDYRKLLFDYVEAEFGKKVLDKAIKSTGKFLPVMLELYVAWSIFKSTADSIDKVDAFVSGKMVQKLPKIMNPVNVSLNTTLKLSKTEIIPHELVYLEGTDFTPNAGIDYQRVSIKFGNQVPVTGIGIVNEFTVDSKGAFKTWLRLPNKFSDSYGSIAENTLKTVITIDDGNKKSEIVCNLIKKPFINFNDGTDFITNQDGLPLVSAVGPITLGFVLNHQNHYASYPLKITVPTVNEQVSSVTLNSRNTVDFFGSPKLLLKAGKQVIKIENTTTKEVLTETIFVKEPSTTRLELSGTKFKNGDKIICNLHNFSATNGSRYKVAIKGPTVIGDHISVKLPLNLLSNGIDSFEIMKGRNTNLFEYDELKKGVYEIQVTDVPTNLTFKTTFEVTN